MRMHDMHGKSGAAAFRAPGRIGRGKIHILGQVHTASGTDPGGLDPSVQVAGDIEMEGPPFPRAVEQQRRAAIQGVPHRRHSQGVCQVGADRPAEIGIDDDDLRPARRHLAICIAKVDALRRKGPLGRERVNADGVAHRARPDSPGPAFNAPSRTGA
jgi:hypothetical protein